MIKNVIASSVLLVVLCPAYGSPGEPSCVSTVANKYMSSISGGGKVSPSKIITLKRGSDYAAIYSDIPTGSAIGANGNMGMQFVDVKTDGILGCYVSVSRSTPIIQFSRWPITKYISTSNTSMVIDIRKYGPRDPEACMSYVYQETIVRNRSHNWIVKTRKLISKGGC